MPTSVMKNSQVQFRFRLFKFHLNKLKTGLTKGGGYSQNTFSIDQVKVPSLFKRFTNCN